MIENLDVIFLKTVDERTQRERNFVVQFLASCVPFLKDLQKQLLHLLTEKLEPVEFNKGEVSKYLMLLTYL